MIPLLSLLHTLHQHHAVLWKSLLSISVMVTVGGGLKKKDRTDQERRISLTLIPLPHHLLVARVVLHRGVLKGEEGVRMSARVTCGGLTVDCRVSATPPPVVQAVSPPQLSVM